MSSSVVNVQGLAELSRALQDLPARIEANVLRGALRAGSSVVAGEAERLAPQATGALKQTVRVSARRRGGNIVVTVKAGGRRKGRRGSGDLDAFYAHWVEYGTAPHWIKPKNRKSLLIARLMREAVKHPGARAKPFMRPAFDRSKQAAVEAVRDYIAARLPKEIARRGAA